MNEPMGLDFHLAKQVASDVLGPLPSGAPQPGMAAILKKLTWAIVRECEILTQYDTRKHRQAAMGKFLWRCFRSLFKCLDVLGLYSQVALGCGCR